MPDAAAFSNPLARARWKVSKEAEIGTAGINQQVRFTFTGGAGQFETTVKVLQEMTNKYVTDPEVIQFTRRLFNQRRLRNHDYLGEIGTLVQYFQGTHTTTTPDHKLGEPLLAGDKGSYRYQLDPYGAEYFQSPVKVLRDIHAGESGADCDDIAMAAACCLAAAGYPAMLAIVDAGQKGAYNHVMLSTRTPQPNPKFGDDWFPVELIHPFELGQSVKVHSYIPLRVQEWDLTSKEKRLIPTAFR